MALVCRMSGTSSSSLRGCTGLMARLESAVEELGLEPGGMDTPISINHATGYPWRARFSPSTLYTEKETLLDACYVICAYLSGMRDSELQSLKRGCYFPERSEDGVILRHKLRGIAYKGQGDEGTPEKWVVIQLVADAISVLEQLAPGERLFAPIEYQGDDPEARFVRPTQIINDFRDYINATQSQGECLAIPDHEGRPWHLTSSQFRRTLAWHIANQPFGIVAGKIQYKHVSTAVFEGYAGTSSSGLPSDVETERQLQQMEDIVEQYEDYCKGRSSTGPGAARINGEFDRVRRELGDFPGIIADRARVRAMLLHVAKTLYPGTLNDCFFEPAVALCLRHVKSKTPVFSFYVPGRCANSRITARHKVAWIGVIASAREHLSQQRLSDLQKLAIKNNIAEMESVIAPLGGETDGH